MMKFEMGPIWREGLRRIRRRPALASMCAATLVGTMLTPAAPERLLPKPSGAYGVAVHAVNDHIRFIPTMLQIGLPLLMRDAVGLQQVIVSGLVSTAATQGSKRLFENVEWNGVRLGQRPYGADSNHNMPSGHSALVTTSACFVARRYGWKWLWLLLPIVLAGLFARVALGAHTIPAVLAGALIGIFSVLPFATTWKSPQKADASQHHSLGNES